LLVYLYNAENVTPGLKKGFFCKAITKAKAVKATISKLKSITPMAAAYLWLFMASPAITRR
jgi:hypothetical protein